MAGKSVELQLNIKTQFQNIEQSIGKLKESVGKIDFSKIFSGNSLNSADGFKNSLLDFQNKIKELSNFNVSQSGIEEYKKKLNELANSFEQLKKSQKDFSKLKIDISGLKDYSSELETAKKEAEELQLKIEEANKLNNKYLQDYKNTPKKKKQFTESQNLLIASEEQAQKAKDYSVQLEEQKKKITELEEKQKEYIEVEKESLQIQQLQKDSINIVSSEQKKLNEVKKTSTQLYKEITKEEKQQIKLQKEEAKEKRKLTQIQSTFVDEMTKTISAQDKLSSAIENQIVKWGSFRAIITFAKRAITDIIQTYQQLDDSLSAISAVSGISTRELWGDMPSMIDNANALALSIDDLTSGMLTLYQQGLNTVEVETRLEAAGKLAAISQQSLGTAVDQLTAVMNTFNLSTEDSTRVVDILANESANSAISVAELGTALQPVASLAASAGMSLETTAAFVTTMESTTRQSASVIGNALKTIIARFQQLKSSTDELEDGTSANDVEEALASAGVALRDATGSFRDFDEVIMELSSKWDTLDSNTQRYIATVGAGTRQQSQFIALVSNYAKNVENISTATNSAGAAEQQFQAVSTNLSAALNKLDNNFAALKTSFMEGTGILSSFINMLAGLVGIIAKIPAPITLITTVIGTLALKTIVLTSAQKARLKAEKLLEIVGKSNLTNTQKSAIYLSLLTKTTKEARIEEVKRRLNLEELDDSILNVIDKTEAEVLSNVKLSFSFDKLKTKFLQFLTQLKVFQIEAGPVLWVIEGIAAAIVALGGVITYNNNKLKKMTEQVEDFNSSAAEHADLSQQYRSEADSLEYYSQKLEEARKNGEDLTSIREEMSENFSSEDLQVDILTTSYYELSEAIKDTIVKKKELSQIELYQQLKDEEQATNTEAQKYKTAYNSFTNKRTNITGYKDENGNIISVNDFSKKYGKEMQEQGLDMTAYAQSIGFETIYTITLSDENGPFFTGTIDEYEDKLKSLVERFYSQNEIESILANSNQNFNDKVINNDTLSQNLSLASNFTDIFDNGQITDSAIEVANEIEMLTSQIQDSLGLSSEEIVNYLQGSYDKISTSSREMLDSYFGWLASQSTEQTGTIFDIITQSFENSQKASQDKINNLLKDYSFISEYLANKIGDNSINALNNVLQGLGEDGAKALTSVLRNINNSALSEFEKTGLFDSIGEIFSDINFADGDSIEKAIEQIKLLSESGQITENQFKMLMKVFDDTSVAIERMNFTAEKTKSLGDMVTAAVGDGVELDQLQQIIKSAQEAGMAIEDLGIKINETNGLYQINANAAAELMNAWSGLSKESLNMAMAQQIQNNTALQTIANLDDEKVATEGLTLTEIAAAQAQIAAQKVKIQGDIDAAKARVQKAKTAVDAAKSELTAEENSANGSLDISEQMSQNISNFANWLNGIKTKIGEMFPWAASMGLISGTGWVATLFTGDKVVSELKNQLASAEKDLADAESELDKLNNQMTDLDNASNALEAYKSQLTATSSAIDGMKNAAGKGSGGASKATDALTKEIQKQIDALEDYKTELEDTKKRLEEEKKALEALNKTLKENLKLYLDLIKTRLSDEIEKQTTAVESFYDAIKNSIQSEIDAFEEKLDSLQKEADKLQTRADELQESADKEEESLNKLYNAATNYYDAVTDGIDNEIELQDQSIERNQLKIDLLEEQKSAIQEQIDNLDKAADSESKLLALEKARDALANARSQKTRLTLTNGGGWRLKTDNQTVQDAQSNLATAQKDYQKELLERQQEKLDTQISVLEDQNNILEETKDSLDEQKSYIESIKDDWETAQENLGKSTSEIEEQTRLIREFMQTDEIGRQNLLNGFVQGVNSNAQSQQAAQDAANKAQLAQDELDYQSNADNANSIQSAIEALKEQQNQASDAQQKYFDNLLSNNAEQIAIQKQMEQLVQSMLTADIGSLEAFQVFQEQLNGAFESANEYASNQAEYINRINETIDYYTEMSERLDMTTDEINQRQAILNEINNATLASLIEGGATFNKLDGQYQEIIRNNNQTEYMQGQIDQVSNEINDVSNQISALNEQSNQIANEAKQTSNNNTKSIKDKIGSSSNTASQKISDQVSNSSTVIKGETEDFKGKFINFAKDGADWKKSLGDISNYSSSLKTAVIDIKNAIQNFKFPTGIYFGPAASRGAMLGFSNGGVDEVTRAVQVHGTKNRPELILNNSQSAALFKYIDSMTRIPTLSTAGSARNALSAFNTSNNTTNEGTSFTGCEFNIESNANNIDSLVRELKQSSPMKRN